ncbi:hypothetical protein Tco_0710084 [Tanacetum coccineum]
MDLRGTIDIRLCSSEGKRFVTEIPDEFYRELTFFLVICTTASRQNTDLMFCAISLCKVSSYSKELQIFMLVKRSLDYLKAHLNWSSWISLRLTFELRLFLISDLCWGSLDRKSTTGVLISDRDGTVYKEWEDRMERTATTASSLDAEQNSSYINRTQSMAILNESFPQGTDSSSGPRFESSIRSDLHLEDAGGTDCLPTATIFEELARMGYEKPSQRLTFYKAFFSPQWKFLIHTITQCLSAKTTAWNEFSSTMASAIICLATNQKFNLSKYIFDAMKKQSRRKQRKETEVSQDETHPDDSVPIPSNDPLLKEGPKVGKEKKKSRTIGLKRLRKVGESRRVESSEDKDSMGAQEDASKQGRIKIVDETQGRPKARGVVVQEPSEFRTTTSSPQASQPLKTKDKVKAIMIEPEVPLKRKDQVALDEEMARNLEAQLQAELIEKEKMARKKEEEANIALIES